jgi:hypothetical protein
VNVDAVRVRALADEPQRCFSVTVFAGREELLAAIAARVDLKPRAPAARADGG